MGGFRFANLPTQTMISNKCHYALRAMLELALREGRGPVTIGQIASAQHIPVRFLEAILRQLKQAGLADSVRGKEGGYFLARKAHEIPVGEVLRLFEGPFLSAQAAVAPHTAREKDPLDVFVDVWKDATAALNSVFDRHTFGELAERELNRSSARASNYSI
jgi:Rrf2 family cysteine metabolism transcriptional repressor